MLGQLIREKRLALELTLEEVGQAVGTSRQSVNNWESNVSVPGAIKLVKLSKTLQIPLKTMLLQLGGINVNEVMFWDSDTPMAADDVEVPFYTETALSAGPGRSGNTQNEGPKLRFSRATLKRSNVRAQDMVCVKIEGDSMEPKFSHGGTVGIDTAATNIINGQIYALMVDGDARIKRLFRKPGGVKLVSYHPDKELYPDEQYEWEGAHEVQIIGRVFWYSVLL